MSSKNIVLAESKEEHECRCHEYSKDPPATNCPLVKKVTHPLRYYQFTEDEMKALEECDRESFYQRCLPLSTLFATVTYAAMRYGFTSRSPIFGVWPKVVLAGLLGHCVGRVSYIPTEERKLRLLDGPLGCVMRQHCRERNAAAPQPNK